MNVLYDSVASEVQEVSGWEMTPSNQRVDSSIKNNKNCDTIYNGTRVFSSFLSMKNEEEKRRRKKNRKMREIGIHRGQKNTTEFRYLPFRKIHVYFSRGNSKT